MIGKQINIYDYPGGPVLGTGQAEVAGLLKPGSGLGSGAIAEGARSRGEESRKKTMMELQRLAEMGRWRGAHIASMDLSKERGHI